MTENQPPRKTIQTRRRRRVTPDQESHPYLIVMSGLEMGRRFRLFEGSTFVGRSRDDCEVYLEDEGVSRCHAEVTIQSERVATVRDCGSTNGTLRNGQTVTETASELRDGDKLELGDTLILELRYQSDLTASVQEHMYSSSVRDPLTEIYNKAYLNGRLEQELAFAIRNDTPLALVVLDLDHFKQVNDTYGHAAGDHVLKAVCRLVEENIRPDDVFARYGGEEFVILFKLGLNATLRAADRIRRLVSELTIEHDGNRIPVTLSLGVALTTHGQLATTAELFGSADENLYRAKHAGRNRVCGPGGLYDPS